MDRSNVINLIKLNQQQNAAGIWETVDYTELLSHYPLSIDEDNPQAFSEAFPWRATEVFCDVRSITKTEWFEAGRNGIEHPEFIFIINRNEYDDEKIVEYNGKFYGVYRTYEAKNENLELYVEAKGGLTHGQ